MSRVRTLLVHPLVHYPRVDSYLGNAMLVLTLSREGRLQPFAFLGEPLDAVRANRKGWGHTPYEAPSMGRPLCIPEVVVGYVMERRLAYTREIT
jgi:hypothetical protein